MPTIGWYSSRSWSCSSAAGRSRASRVAAAHGAVDGLARRTGRSSLPAALAARSARSACADGGWLRRRPARAAVTPMLPETAKTSPGPSPSGVGARNVPVQQLDEPLGEAGGLLGASPGRGGRTRRHRAGRPGRRSRAPARSRAATSDEQLVPGLVAGDVVDRLEAVEVEQQHAAGSPSAARARAALSAAMKPGAVGQAGQVVGVGHALELELGAAPLGDVAQVQHEPVAGSPGADSPGRPADDAVRTVSNCRHATVAGRAAGTPGRGRPPGRPPGRAPAGARAGRRGARSPAAGGPPGRGPTSAPGPCPALEAQVICSCGSSTIVMSAARCTRVRK